MKKKVKITIIGGGSVNWCPTIIRDIMKIDGLSSWDFRLLDINPPAARRIARLGQKIAAQWDLEAKFLPTDDQQTALKDADLVIITIREDQLEVICTTEEADGHRLFSFSHKNICIFIEHEIHFGGTETC